MSHEVLLDPKGWTNVLAEVPLFQGLGRRHLKRVAGIATIRRFHDRTEIVRAGEVGDALYVVLDGAVEVRRRGLRAIELGIGAFFGEMALLDGAARSATVVASGEPVVCLRISRPAFVKLLRSEPTIALGLLAELSARLRVAQATLS